MRVSLRIKAQIILQNVQYFKSNAAFPLFLRSERVCIVTWNVGSAVPPDDITSLFGPNVSDGTVDMFIIG